MHVLKMLTCLSGSEYTLSPGDEHPFDKREAASLIRAGFAVATDGFVPPVVETEEEQAEREAAEAASPDAAPEEPKPAKKKA